MIHRLVVDPRVELAPGELADVVQVETLLLVVEHVHTLVGIKLFRRLDEGVLELDEIAIALETERQLLGPRLVGA